MEEIYEKIADEDEFGKEFQQKSDIQNFFTGQTVFLTGCTGYLGKCFVEKLLRSCPDIGRLYVLVRPRNETVSERIEKYFQHLVFDKLRKMMPNFEKKVTAIDGDMAKKNLGLTEHDRNTIVNEVTIIIHAASDVKFHAPISKLFRTNVLGTQYMLDLASETKQLESFVYVSTAYSHCYRQHIEERCYPVPTDLKMIQDFIDIDERTPGGISETAREEVCAPWPNIYSFSKAVAESLVEEFAKTASFACIIYRPSIVVSTYQEPIRGWTGNINGPSLLIVGTGRGYFHIMYGGNCVIDFVPCDMCVNALLAIIWDCSLNRTETNTVLVYNYGSSVVRQIYPSKFEEQILKRAKEIPTRRMRLPYFVIDTSRLAAFWILHFIFHFMGAVFYDVIRIITFHKPIAIRIYYKIKPNITWMLHFMSGNWRIHVEQTQLMWDRMSEIDKHLFYNDLRIFNWDDYFYTYWAGLREYILNDPVDGDLSYLRKYAIIMRTLRILRVLLIVFILYYFRDFFLLLLTPFCNFFKFMCYVDTTYKPLM